MDGKRCELNEKAICEVKEKADQLEKEKYEMKNDINLIKQEQQFIKKTVEEAKDGIEAIKKFIFGDTTKEKEKTETKNDEIKKMIIGFILNVIGPIVTALIMYFLMK